MQAMRLVVCVAAAVIGACADAPDVEVTSYTQHVDSCPNNQCGDGNSPVVNGVYFWRMHIAAVPGDPNPEDVRIVNVFHPDPPPQEMRLDLVDGDRLRVVNRSTGAPLVDFAEVVGTRIRVEVRGQPYVIKIVAARPSEAFWVRGSPEIWEYQFLYTTLADSLDPNAPRIPLCSEGADPNMLSAIVFGGDLYNPDTKEITVGDRTDGWMNVACTGSAIYKMHKIGYTSAAAKKLLINTTLPQRRAMLNAWTSKVCKAGRAFTVSGEPLKLRESLGILSPDSSYLDPLDTEATASIEAIWGETGALCLTVHRREDNDAQIRAEIERTCGVLPSCDKLVGDWTHWTDLGYVLTGNPKPTLILYP